MEETSGSKENAAPERDEYQELKMSIATLEAEIKESFDKNKKLDAFNENARRMIEKFEAETERANRMSEEYDKQTKFYYKNFVAFREKKKKLDSSFPSFFERHKKLELEVEEANADLKKACSEWKAFCEKHTEVIAKHEKAFDDIPWAANYKKLSEENKSLSQKKIELDEIIAELKKEAQTMEDELFKLTHDEMPWQRVCIQFAEMMVKNGQIKADIEKIRNEMKMLELDMKDSDISPLPATPTVVSKQALYTVRQASPNPMQQPTPKKVRAISPKTLNNQPKTSSPLVAASTLMTRNAKENVLPTIADSFQFKNPDFGVGKTQKMKSVQPTNTEESMSNDSQSEMIHVNIDDETAVREILLFRISYLFSFLYFVFSLRYVPLKANAPLAKNANQSGTSHKLNQTTPMETTFPFSTGGNSNEDSGNDFMKNMFNIGMGTQDMVLSEPDENTFINMFHNNATNSVGKTAGEPSNDSDGFFGGMFGNFGMGPSPTASNDGDFPFMFGGGAQESNNDEQSRNNGIGFYGF